MEELAPAMNMIGLEAVVHLSSAHREFERAMIHSYGERIWSSRRGANGAEGG